MIRYRSFVESKYDRTCGFYQTYGVSVFNDHVLIRIIKDVTLDRNAIDRLVQAFNAEGLEPAHLNQAIEDFLYDPDDLP